MLLYWILLPIVWVLAHILFRFEVIGRENLKAVRDGRAYVIAPNHIANLDPVLIAITIFDWKRLRILAKEELFKNPLAGWFLRCMGAVSIERGKGDTTTVEKLTNEWDGLTHDYTKKDGVVHSEILLPAHAPPAFSDRSTLWNSVELTEKSNNAQLAREVEIALPVELSREEQTRLCAGILFLSICFQGHDRGLQSARHGRWESTRPYPADHAPNGRKGRVASEVQKGICAGRKRRENPSAQRKVQDPQG